MVGLELRRAIAICLCVVAIACMCLAKFMGVLHAAGRTVSDIIRLVYAFPAFHASRTAWHARLLSLPSKTERVYNNQCQCKDFTHQLCLTSRSAPDVSVCTCVCVCTLVHLQIKVYVYICDIIFTFLYLCVHAFSLCMGSFHPKGVSASKVCYKN